MASSRRGPVIISVAVVLVALFGVAGWWFFIRDDSPDELALPTEESSAPGDTDASGDGGDTEPAGPAEGSWEVTSGEPTEAGLRIDETFAGAIDNTAVGRTGEVSGSMTIDGTEVTGAEITVDLTSLEFTDSPPGFDVANRSTAMEGAGLETDEFPETTFTLTEPIALGEIGGGSDPVMVEATGQLTLHGVTNEVTVPLEAQRSGDAIEVASADPVPVALADYDIEPPVLGPVADVADEGGFELVVRFTRA